MKDSKNKGQRGFFSNALGVAKKLSDVGLDVIQQVTAPEIEKVNFSSNKTNVIEGVARKKGLFEANQYESPKHILETHLPQASQSLFGKHYAKVDRVASFISPEFSEKVTDFVYEHINTLTNQMSSVDAVLDEAGIRDLEELTQDVSRSQRISKALAEQNKWIASVQGAISGMTGTVGATVDIPLSMMLSLRTIYQIGRAHGFDLNKEAEQDIVQYIFKQVNLGLIAEKQAILMGLKAVSQTLQTHDVYQLQQLLGSSNDIQALKKWLSNESGEMKWQWLNNIPHFSKVTKLVPIASATVGAIYSWKLVEDVQDKAQVVFGQAREYLIQHQDVKLSPLIAYEKSLELLQVAPKLFEQVVTSITEDQVDTVEKHQTVAEVSEQIKDENVKVETIKPARNNVKNTSTVKPKVKATGKAKQVTETSQELKKAPRAKPVTKKSTASSKE